MSNRAKEFYLTIVRHGQTIANIQKTIQGHSDTPLSELGIEQAKALSEYFQLAGPKRFDRIYSSDLSRASETCRIIAPAAPHTRDDCEPRNGAIALDVRLRERRYGPFEGQLISQLQVEASTFGYTASNFTRYTPKGAESMEQVAQRAAEFCQDTLWQDACDGQEVLLVSHWATIKEILKLMQPFSNGSIRSEHLIETPNTAVSRFKIRCQRTGRCSGQSQSIAYPIVISNDEPSVQNTQPNGWPAVAEQWTLAGLQVIYLHQTPHLRLGSVSVNLTQKLD